VADAHPITHPPKTNKMVCEWLVPDTATPTQIAAQTTPQATLYDV
jgi:hypothetical protein